MINISRQFGNNYHHLAKNVVYVSLYAEKGYLILLIFNLEEKLTGTLVSPMNIYYLRCCNKGNCYNQSEVYSPNDYYYCNGTLLKILLLLLLITFI